MKPTQLDPDSTHFDVRDIPCKVKHTQIFKRWSELPVGSHFVLINDHDPVPLYYQFSVQYPGAFTWDYLMRGPDECRVRIGRTAETVTISPAEPCSGAAA